MLGKFVGLIAVALTVSTSYLYGTDVKITDTKANTLEVRDAAIDYTSYNIIYSPDYEREGVRAYQGEGVVTIKWVQIEQIVIKTVKPDRSLEADVTLKNKKVLSLHLVRSSEKGLFGTTDLGDFKIDLQDISTIAVLPPRDKQ